MYFVLPVIFVRFVLCVSCILGVFFKQCLSSMHIPLPQSALLLLFAQFIVIHAFVPTFLFLQIVSFIIFNMAHLSCSYLLYSFFFFFFYFTGIIDLMIPTGSIKVWSYFNFSFEISGRNSILNFIWFFWRRFIDSLSFINLPYARRHTEPHKLLLQLQEVRLYLLFCRDFHRLIVCNVKCLKVFNPAIEGYLETQWAANAPIQSFYYCVTAGNVKWQV